jgi:hypothetical protein
VKTLLTADASDYIERFELDESDNSSIEAMLDSQWPEGPEVSKKAKKLKEKQGSNRNRIRNLRRKANHKKAILYAR